MVGAEAQGSAECQGSAAVLAIDNDSIPMSSELGCSGSAQSSHQHCSQPTDRPGTVIFSEVQTTAPPSWDAQPGPEAFTAPAFPFLPGFVSSLIVFVQVVERHTVPLPAWPLRARVS